MRQGFELAVLNCPKFVFKGFSRKKDDLNYLMIIVGRLSPFGAFECGLAVKSLAKYCYIKNFPKWSNSSLSSLLLFNDHVSGLLRCWLGVVFLWDLALPIAW